MGQTFSIYQTMRLLLLITLYPVSEQRRTHLGETDTNHWGDPGYHQAQVTKKGKEFGQDYFDDYEGNDYNAFLLNAVKQIIPKTVDGLLGFAAGVIPGVEKKDLLGVWEAAKGLEEVPDVLESMVPMVEQAREMEAKAKSYIPAMKKFTALDTDGIINGIKLLPDGELKNEVKEFGNTAKDIVKPIIKMLEVDSPGNSEPEVKATTKKTEEKRQTKKPERRTTNKKTTETKKPDDEDEKPN